MNGESLIFQIVVIAALALVFGAVVAAAVRFTTVATQWMHRRHVQRR